MATKSIMLKEVSQEECFCFPLPKKVSGVCKHCWIPLKTFPKWGICLCEECKIICKSCGKGKR